MNKKHFIYSLLILMLLTIYTPSEFIVYADDYSIDGLDIGTDDGEEDGYIVVGTKNEKNGETKINKLKSSSAWNQIFSKGKTFLLGFTAICTLTFIVFFLINITKLSTSADNPQMRSQVIKGLLWTGIAAAGFGSSTIFFLYAQGFFN